MAFNDLINWIEEKVDTNEEVYGPAQTVKLLETCDINVEINNRIIAWKLKPKYKINGNMQYDTFLMVKLEIKAESGTEG